MGDPSTPNLTLNGGTPQNVGPITVNDVVVNPSLSVTVNRPSSINFPNGSTCTATMDNDNNPGNNGGNGAIRTGNFTVNNPNTNLVTINVANVPNSGNYHLYVNCTGTPAMMGNLGDPSTPNLTLNAGTPQNVGPITVNNLNPNIQATVSLNGGGAMNGNISLVLDNDTNPGNGFTNQVNFNATGQTSQQIVMNNPPSGTFFLYAEHNAGGMKRGWFGSPDVNAPGAANYTPGTSSATVTITMY